MANPITGFQVMTVKKPKVGENVPAEVRAEVLRRLAKEPVERRRPLGRLSTGSLASLRSTLLRSGFSAGFGGGFGVWGFRRWAEERSLDEVVAG